MIQGQVDVEFWFAASFPELPDYRPVTALGYGVSKGLTSDAVDLRSILQIVPDLFSLLKGPEKCSMMRVVVPLHLLISRVNLVKSHRGGRVRSVRYDGTFTSV